MTDEAFSWLNDRLGRRNAIRQCTRAVRAGWLEGSSPAVVAKRRAMLAAMQALLDERLTDREFLSVADLVAAMATADQDAE